MPEIDPRSENIASSPLSDSRTRASLVFDRIHLDIVTCKLSPGQRLLFRMLMKRYDSGITTIREALLRLVAVGLVLMEEQRGFVVSSVSRADLLELTALRRSIEEMALSNSIANATDDSDGEILKCHHRFSKLSSPPAFGQKNMEALNATFMREIDYRRNQFYASLVARCDAPRLLQFRSILLAQNSRYQHLQTATTRASAVGQYSLRPLMEAVLDRNAKRARELLGKDIERSTELLLADPKLANLFGPLKIVEPSKFIPSGEQRRRKAHRRQKTTS